MSGAKTAARVPHGQTIRDHLWWVALPIPDQLEVTAASTKERARPLRDFRPRTALHEFHERADPQRAGVLSVLRAGDKPEAIEFGLRHGDVLHSWFGAYNPDFSKYSPGLVLLLDGASATRGRPRRRRSRRHAEVDDGRTRLIGSLRWRTLEACGAGQGTGGVRSAVDTPIQPRSDSTRHRRDPHLRDARAPAPAVGVVQRQRVGIVGAGGIAAEHLRVLTARPDVEVLGIADRSAATARWVAQRWQVSEWFTDHHALLAARPDVVHVLTPPPTHFDIAHDALRAGAHVVGEKPLVATRAELLELHELAQKVDRWLLEDQNYRWNDVVLWLSSVVASGRLGAVRDVEVAMALAIRAGGAFADPHMPSPAHQLPGGVLHDFLPHLAYLGLLFAPGLERADHLRAAWSNLGGDDGLWRADDLDATIVDGPVNLRLRFSAQTRPDRFEITVRGTEGDATVDLFQPFERLRVARAVGEQLTPLVNQVANGAALTSQAGRNFAHKLTQRTPYHGMWRFIDLVYDRLRDGGEPPLSFEQIDASATLVERLVEDAP